MFSLLKKKVVKPQKPIPFGWKTGWFCIQAEPDFILSKIAKRFEPISWEDAIETRLLRSKPFLTPSFEGWTILSHDLTSNIQSNLSYLVGLLDVDVAHFESYRGVSAAGFGWTKNKKVVRTHRQADGQLLENFGEISPEEISLGIVPILDFELEFGPEQEDEIWEANPDEEDITNLSGLIGVDPTKIDSFPDSIPFRLDLIKFPVE